MWHLAGVGGAIDPHSHPFFQMRVKSVDSLEIDRTQTVTISSPKIFLRHMLHYRTLDQILAKMAN